MQVKEKLEQDPSIPNFCSPFLRTISLFLQYEIQEKLVTYIHNTKVVQVLSYRMVKEKLDGVPDVDFVLLDTEGINTVQPHFLVL